MVSPLSCACNPFTRQMLSVISFAVVLLNSPVKRQFLLPLWLIRITPKRDLVCLAISSKFSCRNTKCFFCEGGSLYRCQDSLYRFLLCRSYTSLSLGLSTRDCIGEPGIFFISIF